MSTDPIPVACEQMSVVLEDGDIVLRRNPNGWSCGTVDATERILRFDVFQDQPEPEDAGADVVGAARALVSALESTSLLDYMQTDKAGGIVLDVWSEPYDEDDESDLGAGA